MKTLETSDKPATVPAATTTKVDRTAAANVRRAASEAKTGLFHGRVPPAIAEELYRHADMLAEELVRPATGHGSPRIVLSFDVEDRRQLGHYKIGRDGLGLAWRISLNLIHLGRPKAQVVGTLLHEILHAVQHESGKPGKGNYHNAEFRVWCESLGIPTDECGVDHGIVKGGLFDAYCERHKLEGSFMPGGRPPADALPPGMPMPPPLPRPKGSKLKKWSCQDCVPPVNVRVAVPDFEARCNRCLTDFVYADKGAQP